MEPQMRADQIMALGREVFGREISEEDDFFSIGGDSLNAVEFISRLEAMLGREVELHALWDAETFRDFAEQVSKGD